MVLAKEYSINAFPRILMTTKVLENIYSDEHVLLATCVKISKGTNI